MTYTLTPSVKVTDLGALVPDSAEILSGRLDDFSAAFGGNMSRQPTTPQGQIAISDTAILEENNALYAKLINEINPCYASGRMQDAIGEIYFLYRLPARATVVECVLTGSPSVQIPKGVIAKDQNGFEYTLDNPVTFDSAGKGSGFFTNKETGAIVCGIGTLNKVISSVAGWEGINNEVAGIVGRDAEGRAEFEYRRKKSVFLNSLGFNGTIYAKVFQVENVVDAEVFENPTGQSITYGETNYTLKPHSVLVSVYGGADYDIAKAILYSKSGGCDMNGNTTIQVTLENEYRSNADALYNITFLRPSTITFKVKINVNYVSTYQFGFEEMLQDAVYKALTSGESPKKARIGSTISASTLYCPVSNIGINGLSINSILLSKNGVDYFPLIKFGVDEMPSLDKDSIEIEVQR